MKRAIGIILLLLIGRLAQATTSASVRNFSPGAATPYFSIDRSKVLPRRQLYFGTIFSYARDPLLRGTGTTEETIVQDLLMTDLLFAAGVADWFEFSLGMPIALQNDAAPLTTVTARAVTAADRTNDFGLGDLRVTPKLRLLKMEDHGFGIALVPFLLMPTGDENHFVGNGGFAGGAKAVIDGEFLDEKGHLSLNAGYLVRSNFVFPRTATERDDAYLLGLGATYRASDWVDLIGEATTSVLVKAPFDREAETPAEFVGGARFKLPGKRLAVTVAGGTGITSGFGSPLFRALVGLTYLATIPKGEPKPEPEPLAEIKEEKIEIRKMIHFATNTAEIKSISYPILDAVVEILKTHPEITKVEIQGHTDNRGSDAFNLKLSERRAGSARQYLVKHGVEGGRLTAKGYGESRPIDTEETNLGWARNRRVEFVILRE